MQGFAMPSVAQFQEFIIDMGVSENMDPKNPGYHSVSSFYENCNDLGVNYLIFSHLLHVVG
jgi:hypothetical protein